MSSIRFGSLNAMDICACKFHDTFGNGLGVPHFISFPSRCEFLHKPKEKPHRKQVPDTTVYANHSMLLDFVFRNSFRIYILYIYYSEETRKKQVPFLKQSSSTIPSEAQTATTAAQIAEHVRQTDFQA